MLYCDSSHFSQRYPSYEIITRRSADFPPESVLEFYIKDVIFHPPATIVYWMDGTKTVVKCCDTDVYSAEVGLQAAIIKKLCGNSTEEYHKLIRKYTEKFAQNYAQTKKNSHNKKSEE